MQKPENWGTSNGVGVYSKAFKLCHMAELGAAHKEEVMKAKAAAGPISHSASHWSIKKHQEGMRMEHWCQKTNETQTLPTATPASPDGTTSKDEKLTDSCTSDDPSWIEELLSPMEQEESDPGQVWMPGPLLSHEKAPVLALDGEPECQRNSNWKAWKLRWWRKHEFSTLSYS